LKNLLTRLLFYLSLLAQLLLAICPFIPWVRENIWATQITVNGFASTLATYIGVEFGCLGIMVALVLSDIRQQGKEATDQFREALRQYTPLQVRPLKENEFYKEFLGHCISAKHYVKICYFAPLPPQHGAPAVREKYYRTLPRVMKANPDTTFKRIIRDTDANRVWAYALVSDLLTATNCSVALLKDLDASKEMPLALSVQIVDERDAWLVAVGEHAGSAMYRDVALENEVLVSVLDRYFDRLWNLSRVVFKPGDSATAAHKAIFEEY
jgi:hypothetical protein